MKQPESPGVVSEAASGREAGPVEGKRASVVESKRVGEDEDEEGDEPAAVEGAWGAVDRSLRQILQELRHQRGRGGEFSYLYVMAIVLQMVALVCLLGGLWMGAANGDLFLRWIFTGLLVQGATIAVLLFAKA
jgi:hypothetical protein